MLLTAAFVFIGMFLLDICWTFYLIKVDERRSVAAGFWAAVIYGLSALVVTTYVVDRLMIIPAVLGSFFGTFVGVELKRRKK